MSVLDPFLDSPAEWGRGDRELAMLRHDVRVALQGVLGGVTQIDPASLPVEAREQFERVGAASRMLARLLGGLEMEDSGPAWGGAIDVAQLLAFMRARYAGEARHRGLRFEIESAPDAPDGLALDLTSVTRILDNLIGNALKYADSGTVRLSVGSAPDGTAEFRVTDEGPGLGNIPGERALRAGEGLGLHIVTALTERLGGVVQISTRACGGVEAEVRFPTSAVRRRLVSVPVEPAADLSGLRVLLAEDNLTNQMVASQMLRALKADVLVCADGVEALEQFDRQPIDLVVVDIEMPRLSGLDVIRAIRARADARAQVPIVALTAYAMREHRERIATAGANGLISKPIVSVEALGRALAAYVHTSARPGAAQAAPPAGVAEIAGPVIDRSTFDALAEAIGPDTMAELLEKVIADLKAAQATLSAALPALDRPPIRSASHILISVAGAIGAVRLQASARTLNALAHGENAEETATEVRRCLDEINAAVAFAGAPREGRP